MTIIDNEYFLWDMATTGTSRQSEREAEYLADAKLSTKGETLSIIEGTTLELLQAVANGQDPTLHLVLLLALGCLVS